MQQKSTLTPSFSALLMRLFLLALVVLLASCGGGGGGDGRGSTKSFALLGVFAGNPYGPGSTDGTGAAARFNSPYGVATDTSGNVYVAESFNHTIRKITPAGVVTTLAGAAGMPGSADGTGSAARFTLPAAVATDASGTVYVVDSGSHTIRKITPAGVVTTLAGTAGVSGSTDGTGSAASFYYPARVATDASGNVYAADSGNNTIRKITPAGVVTTLAGTAGASGSADGTGPEARLNSPNGVATDVSGNVYVADYGNNTIRKITPAGVVTTLAGTAGMRGSNDGTGAESRFSNPDGVATDASGNVYVADSSNNTIRKITPAGVVTTLAGTAGTRGSNDGTGAAASFNGSRGVATDASGNVYVADSFNSAIRKITPAGVVTTLAGTPGVEGSVDGTGAAARFSGPRGVTLDASGNIYVADRTNQTIRKITPAGVVTTLAGTAGSLGIDDGTGAAARFTFPYGLATDAGGNVYVTDSLNYTIRKVTPAGVVTTLAGTARASGSEDGTGGVARFNNPTGLAIDASGNVYVADSNNHTIRKITPAGVVTTLAGTAGVSGGEDGAGAAARFSSPAGLATDASGNVYVADFGNHTIRKITPAGVVTTLAGKASTRGNDNGNGAAARFNSPRGVATDASGAVYVADTYNYTIRKITPAGEVSTLAGTAGLNGFQPGALPGGLFEPSAMAVSDSRIYFSTSNGIAFID